jgi:nitrogen regulatory protein PII 1
LSLGAGEGYHAELPKEMPMLVVPNEDKDLVLSVIMNAARTGDAGMLGDGKVFVSPVDEVWTVSTGEQDYLDGA